MFKRQYTASQIQAMIQAYRGKTIVPSRFIVPIIFTLIVMAFMYLLTLKIVFTGAFGIIAGWYSYVVIIPNEVSASYYRQSYLQRWKAINTMTQAFANKNNQALDILKLAADRAEGEFKDDLNKLVAVMLMNEPRNKVHKTFTKVEDKYYDDDIFKQFLEQIETFYIDGISDSDTFASIGKNYNDTYKETEDFINKKIALRKSVVIYLIVIFLIILMVSNGMGFANWKTVFANSGLGNIASVSVISTSLIYIHFWIKKFYNDTLTITRK
ncbi:hypothetical protein DY052_09135 [Apilactobacillus timberlakei]|uniref:hypothetical protein n=1 Tax=Apilactobacillus timberlakei TaxID=2008380 RepID=UPI00112D1836|nr:hypothetical protein [Apilactobacillus timberlakei]TPR12812.1 hypothetical protein DY052_09135 [Apilactobacillus timberlakei]